MKRVGKEEYFIATSQEFFYEFFCGLIAQKSFPESYSDNF
jgi:hypothetical protein